MTTPTLHREATIRRIGARDAAADAADATATNDRDARRYEVSFGSEYPVRRYFGREILDMTPDAANLERVEAGVAPVLDGHYGQRVGLVESVEIGADRRARAIVRFSRSARATELMEEIDDEIGTAVSFGYSIDRMVLEESSDEEGDTYRAVRWTLLELSPVSVPADPTVGFGRGTDPGEAHETHVEDRRAENINARQGGNTMRVLHLRSGVVIDIAESDFNPAEHARVSADAEPTRTTPTPPAATPPVTVAADAASEVRNAELERIRQIRELGTRYRAGETAETAIREGWPVLRFTAAVVDERLASDAPLAQPVSQLGLSEGETRRYSLFRAIRAAFARDWREAPFERECSEAIATRLDREPQGFFVPYEALERTGAAPNVREITTGGSGAGVQYTEHRPGSFIEALRNRMLLRQLGARVLSGLVGDLTLPRQSGVGAVEWVGEGLGSGTPGELATDVVSLAPRTVRGRQNVTRKMLLQSSPDVEALMLEDLGAIMAQEIDRVGFNGVGSATVPRGILNQVGVGLVSLGTDGGPPTWAALVNLIREVMVDNADMGSLNYATNPQAWAKMMTTPKVAGQPVYLLPENGRNLIGYGLGVTNQVPSTLTKGTGTNLSGLIFGNFGDVLIGEWGVLDINPDPYTAGDSGGLVVRAFQDVDVAVRHPESFAVIVDMVTT